MSCDRDASADRHQRNGSSRLQHWQYFVTLTIHYDLGKSHRVARPLCISTPLLPSISASKFQNLRNIPNCGVSKEKIAGIAKATSHKLPGKSS